MAAMCRLLSFASVILGINLYRFSFLLSLFVGHTATDVDTIYCHYSNTTVDAI